MFTTVNVSGYRALCEVNVYYDKQSHEYIYIFIYFIFLFVFSVLFCAVLLRGLRKNTEWKKPRGKYHKGKKNKLFSKYLTV